MGFTPKALLAALVAVVATAVAAASPALGADPPVREIAGGAQIGAQIDPFLAPGFCTRLQEDGARAATVFLSRGVIERNNGTLNTAGIDSRVSPDIACGIQVAIRVKPTTDPDQDSYLPAGAELSQYLSLLTQLAQYLDRRVGRYAIDNETAAVAHFDGTADDYFELLRQSAAALRAGDPDAEILDGSMASGNLSSVRAVDLYNQGRYGEAISLIQETQANELGGAPPVTDMASLTAYVNDSRVKRSVAFFDGAVANQTYYDAFQLHYYGPWRGQVDAFDYLRSHGITLPIETWEVAHRYRDGRPFIEQEHADETARLLITSAGEGSAFTIFSSYLGTAENDAVGLFAFDLTTEHQARSSFRSVSSELTGATSAERLQVGGDAWGYRFQLPDRQISAAWADPGPARIGDELGIDASTALITTTGVAAPQHLSLAKLEIGGTPVFAEPDLVELQRLGKRSHKRLKLQLTCPAASTNPTCAGRVKVTRDKAKGGKRAQRKDKREQSLGKERFKVARGESEKLTIHFKERGRPGQAVAKTKPCAVRGKGGCTSWTELR